MGSKGSNDDFSQVLIAASQKRFLSTVEFHRLTDVPPEAEWFANLTNENTKRAYRDDLTSFIRRALAALESDELGIGVIYSHPQGCAPVTSSADDDMDYPPIASGQCGAVGLQGWAQIWPRPTQR
jgi:hypothetical protein